MRRLALVLLVLSAALMARAEDAPVGVFSPAECIACHEGSTPDLVAIWRDGPHGATADCTTCHGSDHKGSLQAARKSETCIACHGGAASSVARSYLTSKHGVIATLESARWDWSLPVAEANYRVPSCAYCHMHEGGHGHVAADENSLYACLDCHAPRYVDTMLETARRTLAIGTLKVDEAEAAVRAFAESGIPLAQETAQLETMLATMRDTTLRDLRLGLGHQSPDYQWWYGQAALDGDLIRIKARITRALREDKD